MTAQNLYGPPMMAPDQASSATGIGPSRVLFWYALLLALAIPVADRTVPIVPALPAVFASILALVEGTAAILLFTSFRADGRPFHAALGAATLFAAGMAVGHLVTFPGAILPDGRLCGEAQSTAWVFVAWLVGYALTTSAAIMIDERATHVVPLHLRSCVATVTVVVTSLSVLLLVGLAIAIPDHLPALMDGPSWTGLNRTLTYCAIAIMSGSVLLLLWRRDRAAGLRSWLAVALFAMIASQALSLAGGGRDTLRWSLGRLSWVISAGLLLAYFLQCFSYQQLALARARDHLEDVVADRTRDLRTTLEQRDGLVAELNHRVRNNLQVVDALLDMESRKLRGQDGRDAIRASRSRLHAIGLAHQHLLSSRGVPSVDARELIEDLTAGRQGVRGAVDPGPPDLDIAPLRLDIDTAQPLALIVNEVFMRAERAVGPIPARLSLSLSADETAILTLHWHAGDSAGGSDRATRWLVDENRDLIAGLTRQIKGTIIDGPAAAQASISFPIPSRNHGRTT